MRNCYRDFERTTTHDVLFICMPWMAVEMPSLPLSILSAHLIRAGIDAGVFYPNLEFSRRIGVATYGDYGRNHNLFGDWAFARLLREKTSAGDFGNRTQTRPSMDEALPAFALRRKIPRDQIAGAILVADAVPAFLGWCLDQIDWNRVKLIGFSTTLMQLAPSLALASEIKARYPDVPIMLGGSNCRQPMGNAIFKTFPFIDSVVCGEADEIMVKLAHRILGNVSSGRIPNVLWRNNNQIEECSATDGIAGIIDYPIPNHKDYFKALANHPDLSNISPRLPFEASRGCWWANRAQCRFCGLNGSTVAQRIRPFSSILEELRRDHELYGSSQFVAMDNVLPRQYTPALAQSIKKHIPNARLYGEIRPDVTRRDLEALAKSEASHLQAGIESLIPQVLMLMRKGVTAAGNVCFLRRCSELGIRVEWNFMYGIPNEKLVWYDELFSSLPALFHLAAPEPVIMSLQRFSPFFDHPEKFNIRIEGPPEGHLQVWPLNRQQILDISYEFEFTAPGMDDRAQIGVKLHALVRDWNQHGGSLLIDTDENDAGRIWDDRPLSDHRRYRINAAYVSVLRVLESPGSIGALARRLMRTSPTAYLNLGGREGIRQILSSLEHLNLIFNDGRCFVALTVPLKPDFWR